MRQFRILPRTAAAVAASVLLALGQAVPANANGVTQVSGLLSPDSAESPACEPGTGAYVVSGTLVGCWYTDTFVVEHTSAAGGFRATGTETFVGCLGSDCGRLFTTFTFTAKVVDGIETHGRCHHPIIGGDGDFAGAAGVINMHDLPNGCATYKGHFTY
jgi:hypothetical protein